MVRGLAFSHDGTKLISVADDLQINYIDVYQLLFMYLINVLIDLQEKSLNLLQDISRI